MRQKVIFIGASGAGKTTLINALKGRQGATKTQTLDFEGGYIDIPGEYMDIPRMNYAVTTTAMDSDAVVVVQDATSTKPTTPPNYSKMFNVPVYGVITKIDHPSADIKRASELLKLCGVRGDYFTVSAMKGENIDMLKMHLGQAPRRRQSL